MARPEATAVRSRVPALGIKEAPCSSLVRRPAKRTHSSSFRNWSEASLTHREATGFTSSSRRSWVYGGLPGNDGQLNGSEDRSRICMVGTRPDHR